MKILLIKLKNIGDVLIMTPAIRGIRERHPEARISVLVRAGTEGILAGCKDIDEVLVSAAPEKHKRGFGWWNDLKNMIHIRTTGFDWVFELGDGDRGRWITKFSGAKNRIASRWGWVVPKHFENAFTGTSTQDWQLMHRVEKDYRLVSEFLPLGDEVPPLVFDAPEGVDPLVAEGADYVVIHPVSRWKRKAWPVERWVSVGRWLAGRGLRCVISSGPDPVEVRMAEEITHALGEDARCTRGTRSWSELARLIKGAKLFTGLDTAAMHLAAACQTPVVALFAQSIESHWGPWKCRHEIVRAGGPLPREFPAFVEEAAQRSMLDITGQDVIAACERMLSNVS